MGGFDRVLLDAPVPAGVRPRSVDPRFPSSRGREEKSPPPEGLLLAAIDSCDAKKAGMSSTRPAPSLSKKTRPSSSTPWTSGPSRLCRARRWTSRPGFLRCGSRRFHPSMAMHRRLPAHAQHGRHPSASCASWGRRTRSVKQETEQRRGDPGVLAFTWAGLHRAGQCTARRLVVPPCCGRSARADRGVTRVLPEPYPLLQSVLG